MPISNAAWRASLKPASFRNYGFKVEVGGQSGGRRNVTHEFPERDVPYTEDMGRRARRWSITGYVIVSPSNSNYLPDRDNLISACEAYGPGTLVHPTLGSLQVNCDTYSVSETRERGGFAAFEMVFVEAGNIAGSATGATVDTQAAAQSASTNLMNVSATSLDTANQSSLADTNGTVTA